MRGRILLALFSSLTTILTNGQCIDKNKIWIDKSKIEYGGDFDFVPYIFGCPTYRFEFGGDTSSRWGFNPIDINKIGKDIFPLKAKVDSVIKSYAGNEFFKLVKFGSVEVVYKDSLQKMLDVQRSGVRDNDCKAKYYFYYYFKPKSKVFWYFGIAVNERQEIISPFTFPSKELYRPIDSTITYCEILQIARKKKRIDPVESIKLFYDSTTAKFYWIISQHMPHYYTRREKKYYNIVSIDAADRKRVKSHRSHKPFVF